jgi:2',3'-cyclic-nucleotide 2'-phosphodiesterase (5'-nucleotidase family)
MLLLSAGDVYGGSDAYNRPKCRFIAEMMGRFGYDAVALGEMDLGFGLDAIVQDNDEFNMNIVCANVFRKEHSEEQEGDTVKAGDPDATANPVVNDTPVFPPYRIIERGGIRFGVAAVLSPAVKNAREAARSGDVEALTYVIKKPLPILTDLIPILREEADFVVLLSHTSKGELEEILGYLDGVDMVVLGHSRKQQVTIDPTLIHDVPVYMASHQGQYVGRAVISFDSANRMVDAVNEIKLLDRGVGDDPEVIQLVKEFEDENRRYLKELFVEEQLRGYSESGRAPDVYLGVATCRQCHHDAFDVYTGTRHARAYATLSATYMHRDSGCVPCHSTGYGRPGGFGGVRSIGSPVDLIDVQCEECHGPGAEHGRDGRYREIAANSCVKCHTEEQDPTFDFEEEWKKIEH